MNQIKYQKTEIIDLRSSRRPFLNRALFSSTAVTPWRLTGALSLVSRERSGNTSENKEWMEVCPISGILNSSSLQLLVSVATTAAKETAMFRLPSEALGRTIMMYEFVVNNLIPQF